MKHGLPIVRRLPVCIRTARQSTVNVMIALLAMAVLLPVAGSSVAGVGRHGRLFIGDMKADRVRGVQLSAAGGPNIYPSPHVFRFPDAVLGAPGCLLYHPGQCVAFSRAYGAGQTAGTYKYYFQQFEYGVHPRGLMARTVMASYYVGLFNSEADADISNGNSISMAPRSLVVDGWVVEGDRNLTTGYNPASRVCAFRSARTYRNLSLSVDVIASPAAVPCKRTRAWILKADRVINQALEAYIAGPRPDDQG